MIGVLTRRLGSDLSPDLAAKDGQPSARGFAMAKPPADTPDPKSHVEDYKEICANIRATDEISFKLLGLVPITSGAGIGLLVAVQKSEAFPIPATAICLLSLLGLAATGAIFRWELRNIQRCVWLIHQAAAFEEQHLTTRQFTGMRPQQPTAPAKLDDVKLWKRDRVWPWCWGKTESERALYTCAMLCWLVPLGMGLQKLLP